MAGAVLFTYILANYFETQIHASKLTVNIGNLKRLLENGNFSLISDGCNSTCSSNDWLPWGHWSMCNIPIPGNPNDEPKCYKSLQNRQRTCNDTSFTCKEFNWKLCLHKQSCEGQWSQWSDFSGDCTQNCSALTRNRSCMVGGKVAPGLCHTSKYANAIDIEIKACLDSGCNTNIFTYIVFGIRGLLFIATITLAAWVKRSVDRNKVPWRKKNNSSPTYRHYSFAVDNPDLQEVINPSIDYSDNFYEDTCLGPINSDICPYAVIEETSAKDHVYETPQATSMRLPQDETKSRAPINYRSRSADNIFVNRQNVPRPHTTISQQYHECGEKKPVSRVASDPRLICDSDHHIIGNNSPYAMAHYNSQCLLITKDTEKSFSETKQGLDEDIYTPMRSPTSKES